MVRIADCRGRSGAVGIDHHGANQSNHVASVPGGETTRTQMWPHQAQAPRHGNAPDRIFDEYGLQAAFRSLL